VTASGEGTLVRPGSWNGAKARDGSPEDLRDPIRVHVWGAGAWDHRRNKGPGPGETPITRERREANTKAEERADCGSETNKRPRMRGWEVVAPS
jgi:hypothetical protein